MSAETQKSQVLFPRLYLDPLVVERVYDVERGATRIEDVGGVLLGTALIVGREFHVDLIRVKETPDPGDQQTGWNETAESYLEALSRYDGDGWGWQACKIAGLPDAWVVVITPYQD